MLGCSLCDCQATCAENKGTEQTDPERKPYVERNGQMGGERKNECFPDRCINERTHSPSEAPAFLHKMLCPHRSAE